MLEQASQGRVERLVAGEEAGERQDTLTAQLLNDTTLREDDRHDVAESRESDEDGESTLSLGAEDVAEERGGKDAATVGNLIAGNGGEVGNVDKHVHDANGDDGDRCGALEGADGVLHLGHGVVGVAVADVRPDDVVKRRHDTVRRAGRALKSV